MIIGFKNAEKLVYHYTKADTALNHILKTRRLKFGALTRTNDPKETKQWQFNAYSSKNRSLSGCSLDRLSKDFSQVLKSRANVLCFCQDHSPLSGDHLKDIFLRGY